MARGRPRDDSTSLIIGTVLGTLATHAQRAGAAPDPSKSSYLSVNEEDFPTVLARMSAAKAVVMKRQMDLLSARYDLGDRRGTGVAMSRGKPAAQPPGRAVLQAGDDQQHDMAIGDGPIKTFPLRGINLILATQLTTQEKTDLVAFLRAL